MLLVRQKPASLDDALRLHCCVRLGPYSIDFRIRRNVAGGRGADSTGCREG
jgi:hypothetical protein